MQSIFPLFKTVLDAHIQTKTTCNPFHKASEEFYTVLFDAYHLLEEKKQDTGEEVPEDEDKLIRTTYDALEEAKALIEDAVKKKNTIGMDNLLRSLADRLENSCGTAYSFIKEEEEEESKQ